MTTVAPLPVAVESVVDFGAGLKVIQPNISGIDAVPLLDGQSAGILQAVNSFTIKQRVRWGEALTQGCIEQSNVYDIYDATNGNHVFVAVERAADCVRCCCAPHHSVFVEIKTTSGIQGVEGMARDQLMGFPTAMTMEREGCCNKPCLGCCVCGDMGKNDMYLHAGPLDASIEVGKAGAAHDKCMGHTTQPKCGGFFTPTINIMDRAAGRGEFSALAKVEGPCCFGGCSELCFDSKWNVSRMTPQTWEQKLNMGDMHLQPSQNARIHLGANDNLLPFPDLHLHRLCDRIHLPLGQGIRAGNSGDEGADRGREAGCH